MYLLASIFVLLGASRNCSGEVDAYSNLTFCELKDIERSVQEKQKKTPPPAQIKIIDSMITSLKAKRDRAYLSYKFEMVCDECASRKLSCGNRKAGDTLFVCIDEGNR